MENLENMLQNSWMMSMLFHKSNLNRVKKATGAQHVIHIKNYQGKINCLLIRGKEGEVKYGGRRSFSDWTEQDYDNAIKSYEDEFKQG